MSVRRRHRHVDAELTGKNKHEDEKAEKDGNDDKSPLTSDSHHTKHKKPKGTKRRNGFVFILGGLFGLLLAGFFAGKTDLIELPDIGELSMDSLMDVLPAGFVKDVRDLVVWSHFLHEPPGAQANITYL